MISNPLLEHDPSVASIQLATFGLPTTLQSPGDVFEQDFLKQEDTRERQPKPQNPSHKFNIVEHIRILEMNEVEVEKTDTAEHRNEERQ